MLSLSTNLIMLYAHVGGNVSPYLPGYNETLVYLAIFMMRWISLHLTKKLIIMNRQGHTSNRHVMSAFGMNK